MRDRQQYELAFALVRSSIAEWDPLGLIGGGAPGDEWDHEVARLLSYLRGASSPEEVASAVVSIFGDPFGEEGPDIPSCTEFGRKLHSRLTAAGVLAR
jgi:hypothetical protein